MAVSWDTLNRARGRYPWAGSARTVGPSACGDHPSGVDFVPRLTLPRSNTHIGESMHAPATLARAGAFALTLLGALGCRTDLGECDDRAAREVVFLDTGSPADPRQGIPMFAGQALVATG